VFDGENTTIRLHDQQLVKPSRSYTTALDGDGMLNSTFCMTCHNQRAVHASAELGGEVDGDQLVCAACHANVSNYTTGFGDKQIHGIRYINDSGVYSGEWLRSSAANCTTCHQGSLISEIYVNSTTSVTLPKVSSPLNHSGNASAGSLWNNTDEGYFGPWKNPDSNNLRGCLYCHGNIDKDQTTVDDINLTVHNATALGRVQSIYLDQGSVMNNTIADGRYYCAQCHFPGNVNRSATIDLFTNAGFDAPQNITYNDSGDPDYFFNHSKALEGKSSDRKCTNCHGVSLPGNARMDEFVHNVEAGQGSPDCVACHDLGDSAPSVLNISAIEVSVHAQLNNRSGDPGTTDTEYNSRNRKCWACHSNGSTPSLDVNRGMGNNMTSPWKCPDCHTQSGSRYGVFNRTYMPTVYEHFIFGVDIKANSKFTGGNATVLSCLGCHNRSEMIQENNDPNTGTSDFPDTDGDGVVGGNRSPYHYGRNRSALRITRNSSDCGDGSSTNCSKLNTFPANTNYTYTNCSYCHQNSTTSFDVAMNDTGHKSMLNHTDSSVGPYCTDCHIAYDGNTTVRIHDLQLEKPFRNYTPASDREGMLNSSLCTTCHLNKEVHAETELIGELDSDTLECASCHANVSNYTTGFGDKQTAPPAIRAARFRRSGSTQPIA
jgi:nitrate reductase cytochrome c-type subunit